MLHKTSELRGYHIVASDGEIGHVDDFLIDEGRPHGAISGRGYQQLGGREIRPDIRGSR